MPTFIIKSPDGTQYEVTGPEGSTQEQALAKVQESLSKAPQGNYIDNIGRRFASGAAFGMADEFAARMGSLTGIDGVYGDYEGNLARQRARDTSFQQSNPASAAVSEIAGSIASPVTKLIGGGVASTTLPKYAKYFVEGTTLGALSGAGNSTEGNRTQGATVGGLLGGGLGTAIPAVATGVGSVARDTLQRIMSGPVSPGVGNLSKAFTRDGLTISDAQARLRALGPNAVLADLGGNVRGLAEASAMMPGKALSAAETTLKERAATQGERVIQSAFNAVGVKSIDDLITQRAAAARPLYEAAFSANENKFGAGYASETIDRLLQRPDVQKGLRIGINIIKNEDAATGKPSYFSDRIFEGESLADPNLISKLTPNLRLLDAAKRGMDDILEGYRDPVTRKLNLDQYGRSIEQMRSTLVKELDALTTDQSGKSLYKAARQAWAGPTPVIQALNHIDDVVSKARDASDITGKLFGSKDAREKLRVLFPDEKSYNVFANTIASEKTYAETARQVLGNSRTQFRNAAQEDMQGGGMAEAVLNMAQNPSIGTVLGQGFNAVRNRLASPPTAVADELAPMLFSADPAVKAKALQDLTRRVDAGTILNMYVPAARLGLLGGARVGGYSGGLLGGSNQ